MTRRLLILIVVFGCFFSAIQAQQRLQQKRNAPGTTRPVSNLHQRFLNVGKDSLTIDSLSIIPNSFHIVGIPDSAFRIDYVNATITWAHKPNLDSVFVSYRTFPYRLNHVAKQFTYDSVINKFLTRPYVFNSGSEQGTDNFFNFGNITYNGSFGRAISFGNSQDAVVTSNLNLQISGYLADSIEISAAITDNNIPIQPDGTTAELNEFDKIFLQFKKKNWALSLGDIDLRQNQLYFLNFYKRMQGASFETNTEIGKNITNRSVMSGAIAKGKFTRNVFQGLDGNQGPYRLQGANNEFYFVVLAGTEKVYIDGQLLQRGEDQDYVINYNTAELTFTPKRMITKDSRIQVEFEYADRNYLNVNLYFFDEVNFNNKLKLRLGLFSNSDSRNSPINQTLDDGQKKFLNQLGDSVNRAFYPIAQKDTFSASRIMYMKVDTAFTIAGGAIAHDSVYVYSTRPDSAFYNLSFVDVGAGNGDYLPDLNGANGKVYRWVAPVNGVKQGQFEAAQFLVTPKTQQVMSLGMDYALDKHTVLTTEFAKSHYDVNTLSSIDKHNDNGYATKWLLKNNHPFTSSKKGLELTTNLGYEYVDWRFKPLERLRTVEFLRDWGLPIVTDADNEALYNAGIQLSDTKKNSVRYEFAGYNRGTNYQGIRNAVFHTQELGTWRITDQLSYTSINSLTDKGYFFRPSLEISKRFAKFYNYVAGFSFSEERNETHNKITDSVSALSYGFQNFSAYFKSADQKSNKWGIVYTTRINSFPAWGTHLYQSDKSENINVFAEFLRNKHHQVRVNATYRNLQIINPYATGQQADNSLLGRVEYVVNAGKGLLTGNTLYEVGSGQEQKRDYSYLEVPAGTGQYAWIDLNADGVQQLNEFVLAQFPDQAKFIRVFTPTNEFVKANYNTFNYSINLNPKAVINPMKARGLARFVGKINLQSSLQLNQKQIANGLVQLNPFKSPINDTSLITRTSIFTNTFSFNRSNTKWGFDINSTRNSSKSLLSYGYETNSLSEWSFRARLAISRAITLNNIYRTGINEHRSTSAAFQQNDYHIGQSSVEPGVTYTRGANFRFLISYKYSTKNNSLGELDKLSSQAINSEMKYNILQSAAIQAKFTYSSITYNTKDQGNANSTVSYIILDGLLPGKNYLWNLDFTKKLGGSLELNMQYEGRRPGEGRTVHTGRASLRALL